LFFIIELKILRGGYPLSRRWRLHLSYDSVIAHLPCIQIYLRRRSYCRCPFIPFVILLKLALFSFPLLCDIWIFTLCIPSSVSSFTRHLRFFRFPSHSLIYIYKCVHIYIYAYRINLTIKCKFYNFSHIIALECTSGILF